MLLTEREWGLLIVGTSKTIWLLAENLGMVCDATGAGAVLFRALYFFGIFFRLTGRCEDWSTPT